MIAPSFDLCLVPRPGSQGHVVTCMPVDGHASYCLIVDNMKHIARTSTEFYTLFEDLRFQTDRAANIMANEFGGCIALPERGSI